MTWDPFRYLRFDDERTRPARDLLARITIEAPTTVVDLGCGPGNSTALLAARWPAASVLGVDLDPAMLDEAPRRCATATFERGDVATWTPRAPVDVLFSNATLQWLPDHGALLPRLWSLVAQGGALAIQMPRNYDSPTHTEMARVARSGPWSDKLERVGRGAPVSEPAFYYDVLAELAPRVDVWETTYEHALDGPEAVVDWVRATGLRLYLEPLDEPERAAFLDRYTEAIRLAYPRRPNGRSLLSFRRLFLVAHAA